MLSSKADALRNAEQLAGQGNIPAAIAAYRGLIDANPLDIDSIQALGDLYVRAGRIQEALHELARLADRCLALGPAINAAPVLKKMLDLDPSNTATRMKLAAVYARAGRLDQAQHGFIEAGSLFARKGNLVAATEAVKKALAINPDNSQARAALDALEGQTSPYVVQLPKAEPLMPPPAAPKPTPRNTTELAELGQLLSSASIDFSAADVTDEFIVRQLFAAELLAGCGDIDKAVAVLKRIIDYRPDTLDVRTKLTDIYLRSGMMREASREFLEIAHLYENQGDTVRAKDYTVRAQRLAQQFNEPPARASANPAANRTVDKSQRSTGDQIILGSGTGQMPGPPASGPAAPPAPQPANVMIEPPLAPLQRESVVTAAASASPGPSETVVQEARRRDSKSMLGLADAPAVVAVMPKPQRQRIVFYAVAATVVIALLGGWFAGRRWYAAEMDRAYQTLARANILPRPPQIPGTEQFTLPRAEERMDVRGEAPTSSAPDAPTQPSAAARNEDSPRDEVHKEPTPAPVTPADAPAGNRNAALPASKSAEPPVVSVAPPVTTNMDHTPQSVPGSLPSTVSSAPPPPVEARKATVVIKGESVQRVQPEYPSRAREARQSGAVAVEVSINERGSVVAAQALSGPALLRDPAVAAARRWKFKPATRDGKPVASVSTITFNFKM